MEWKDLYLDKDVEGYLIFKTLSKQKVMENIAYLYKGNLAIEEKDFIKLKNGLALKIDGERCLDYIELYKQIMRVSNISMEPMNKIMKVRSSMSEAYRTRLDAAIIGTTRWAQPFLIKMNIRKQSLVLDILFANGSSYYENHGEIFGLNEQDLYQKLIKKYNMEERI